MFKLSITHQTWLLSFALVLVLAMLTSPLLFQDNRAAQAVLTDVSESLSAAFSKSGLDGITAEYSKLAANVYIEIRDAQGNTLSSNTDNKPSSFFTDVLTTAPVALTEKTSFDFHHKTLYLNQKLMAQIVVGEVKSTPENPWLMASIFLGSVAVAAMLSLFWGYTIRRRLQKLNRLIGQIIQSGDVSLRLPVSSSSKDFDQLETNINGMLDKIESLMIAARNTGNAIAHDLRLPLTRLKNKLEAMALDATDSTLTLEQANREIDHIISIFNALLNLSILESGKQHIEHQQVELSSLLQDALELYQPVAEDKQIAVRTELQRATVTANKQLLFQAVCNVLDNAIKFALSHGDVLLKIEIADQVCITVADNGKGVAAEDMHKLTQRFFRAEKSRTAAGTGLGLSLVKAIVQLHRGQLTFADNTPGLMVKLCLPLSIDTAQTATSAEKHCGLDH